MNEAIRMQISAFVDGELPDSEADLLLRRLSQDAEMRREAADYLEVGRIMRGESAVRGIERLRERILAGIDDKAVEDGHKAPDSESGSALRPLIGIAVAASVALVAIFGLQMTPGVDDAAPGASAVAGAADDSAYATPKPLDEQILQYVESHGAASSELGANGMKTRLTTLRRSEEVTADESEVEGLPIDEQAEDEVENGESADDSQTRP